MSGMKAISRSTLAISVCLGLAWPSTGHAAQDPEALKAQQMEYAKSQFAEGEALLAGGQFQAAVQKYETAYQYAPELHVLNFNIGVASYQGGDCAKAKTSFQRFLDLVPDHPMRAEAQTQLMEIERSGCAAAPPPQPGVNPAPVEDDAPELTARPVTGEDPAATGEDPTATGDAPGAEPGQPTEKKYQFNGLMKGGLALIAVGGAAFVGGAITGLMTRSAATKLGDMGAEQSATGFSPHNYADDDVFKLDRRRKLLGPMTVGLLAGGGALAATGVAIYFVGLKKCKAGGGDAAPAEQASRRGKLKLTGLAPAVMRNGGGIGATFAFAGPKRSLSSRAGTCK